MIPIENPVKIMRAIFILTVGAALALVGCASNPSKPQAKKTFERPWIGGEFHRVSTPASMRTNAQHFAGHGILITRAREETPLAKAGLQEGDLLLAINGKNVRSERDLLQAVDRDGASPLHLAVYRGGEVLEKSIAPGIERYQKIHNISFGVGVATYMVFDLFPNPDFSLVALGYDRKGNRLDLSSARAKYRLAQGEQTQMEKDGWQGLRSEEGWRAWLGPVSFSENKMIVSQEAAP
jgi:membrane-associated protease RseP (regulator of RpoE activity)